MFFVLIFGLIWGGWPLLSAAGGNAFAPLVVLAGVGGLPALRKDSIRFCPDVLCALALLTWLCLTGLWSPVEMVLFSGSLAGGDFAVEAPQVRFGVTWIGCGLLLFSAMRLGDGLSNVLGWLIFAAVSLQLVFLLALIPMRVSIVEQTGADWLPSAQSVGRNANLLALALPLYIGILIERTDLVRARIVSCIVIMGLILIAIRMEGMAALLGLLIGGLAYGVLVIWPRAGFRYLMNAMAAVVLSMPALVWGVTRLFGVDSTWLPVSSHQRLIIWQATLEKVFEKPVLGHGMDAAASWQATFADKPAWLAVMPDGFSVVRIIPNHPHNMALHLWAEAGLVGALLLAGALFFLGRRLPEPVMLSSGVRFGVAGVFGVSVALFGVSYGAWDDSFWASLAIVAASLIMLHRTQRKGDV